MEIRITWKTRTKDILPYLNEDNIQSLLDAVPEYPLEKDLLSMKINEFAEILSDENAFVAELTRHRRALVAFGRMKSYKRQMEEFSKIVKKYDFQRRPEETAAAKGIMFPNLAQRMLSDCVRFFHLKSFDEAENMTLSDWLAVFIEDASNTLFERRVSDAYDKKSKMRQKGGRP